MRSRRKACLDKKPQPQSTQDDRLMIFRITRNGFCLQCRNGMPRPACTRQRVPTYFNFSLIDVTSGERLRLCCAACHHRLKRQCTRKLENHDPLTAQWDKKKLSGRQNGTQTIRAENCCSCNLQAAKLQPACRIPAAPFSLSIPRQHAGSKRQPQWDTSRRSAYVCSPPLKECC